MKKTLERINKPLYHYRGDKKTEGVNPNMSGYFTKLSGDCSGLSGDCSTLSGDIDECDISLKNREKGIDISELVGKKERDD